MQNTLTFNSEKDVRFSRILRFIIPAYLTSLFNTVYTIIDGIFVSGYVGTNALAAINIVYPIVNILTGIALIFATGGSSITALYIGGNGKEAANRSFSVSCVFSILLGSLISACIIFNLSSILLMLGATDVTLKDCKIYAIFWLIGTPIVIGKELFTYFIRVDGSPSYSFATALTGGVLNIVLDFFFIKTLNMGIMGAALATILGLSASFFMGIYYFIRKRNYLVFTLHHLSIGEAFRCMINGLSEFVDQIAIAVTTIIFNRTALSFAGENGIAAVSIIMYLQFLFIGIYFGFSMGVAPIVIYILTYSLAPLGVSFFSDSTSPVFSLAVSGMRIYGFGFLFSGINIFSAIRLMSYGKGHLSGLITFLRSFALLILFLTVLPVKFWLYGLWSAIPVAEFLTLFISIPLLKWKPSVFCQK